MKPPGKPSMLLKRLEINGFKSFAGKTALEFSSGIVGIVGPNGSGKSNVTDAIRWLLGEREAKNLRGDKIEDLIFAGTPKKPRSSMAQVSLVFDNSSGVLPLDFKEIVISRRISRSGDSQYFINDADVRLKDIIDFFSKIKLGTRGLTIISQGSGDIFVRALPQERMMMVQEILGLKEFQLKKNEAQRKLKNTGINLDKVEAMIGEVSPRLRMLKRQTSRWEKRFEVQQELESLENDFYSYKIKTLALQSKKIKEPLPEIEREMKEKERVLDEVGEKIKKLEGDRSSSKKLEELQIEKRDLFSKKIEVERESIKLESSLEKIKSSLGKEDLSLEKARRALLSVKEGLEAALKEGELGKIKELVQKSLGLIEDAFSRRQGAEQEKEMASLESRREEIAKLLKEIEENILRMEKTEREISTGFEDFNRKFREIFKEKEDLKESLKNLSDRKNQIIFSEEKVNFQLEEIKRQIHALGGHFNHFEEISSSQSFSKEFSESELEEMERRIIKLRGEIASIGEIDESLVKEAKEVETHYNFLNKESTDLSKASGDLRGLIKELDQKITHNFNLSFKKVNDAFNNYFRLMFGGGSAKMKVVVKEPEVLVENNVENGEVEAASVPEENEEMPAGIEIDLSIPQKKITSLEVLSGGEKSLVSLAVLFALVSVSPPPFLVLDEVDSALDEKNSKRFSDLIKNFSSRTQFILITHNRVTMESADVLYGVTMDETGSSKILSVKFS